MKNITLIFLMLTSLASEAQKQPYVPYRTNGSTMPKDSSLAVGYMLIPTFATASISGYADRWGSNFGINRTNSRLSVRGSGMYLEYPNYTEVQSMITGMSTITSVFGRTGAITAQEADYQSFYALLSGSYVNPSWISSLAWGKITGAPSFITTESDPTVPAYSKSLSAFSVIKASTDPLYIQNGTTQQASSNFNISGSGTVGGAFNSVGNIAVNNAGAGSNTSNIQFVGSRALVGWDGTLNVAFIKGSDNSKPIWFGGGSTEYSRATSTSFQPGVTNTSSLGTASLLWANAYLSNYQVSLSGLLKGNGAGSNVSAAIAGTDYAIPSSGNVSAAATLSVDVTKEVQIFSGTISTWTLPVITGNTWKKLYIKNRGSGVLTVNANGGTNTIYTTTAVSTFSLNPGESVILVNDGTYWNKI